MRTYRKRARSGWCAGKSYKHDANKAERTYEKEELRKELQMVHEGDDYREKHKSKRYRNEKARLESKINWYENRIASWTTINRERNYFSGIVCMFRDSLKKAKAKWQEKYGEDDIKSS